VKDLGWLLAVLFLVGLVLAGCTSVTPTSIPTPTPLPVLIETPTSMPTPTPTFTPPPTQDAHTGATTNFASIETSRESASSPLLISFRAVDLAHAMFGPVTDYRWAFGDGATGEGPNAEHEYNTAGDYPVILTILYDDGTRSVAEKTVTVTAATPEPTNAPAGVSTPEAEDATATPFPSLVPTTEPTRTPVATEAVAAPAPTASTSVSSFPAQLEGLEISSQRKVIHVILVGLPESVADQAASLPEVTKVEKYLRVMSADYPDPFIGVAPGSELRVGDSSVSLVAGDGFDSGDERVAIPGFRVNSNPYTAAALAHLMMAHTFTTGQSFVVNGIRLRVVDLFRSPDTSSENAILVPLATAQELFGMPGQLTDIFVSVNSEDDVETVTAEIRAILSVK